MSMSYKWAHTEVKIQECNYTWTISNYSYLDKKMGEFLASPYVEIDTQLKCKLMLYPMGQNETSKDYLSLFLHCELRNMSTYNVHCKLAIVSNKGDKIFKQTLKQKWISSQSWGISNFLKHEILEENESELLVSDSLVIHCSIRTFTELVQKTVTNHVPELPDEEPFLKKYFLDERFSDVKLVAPCGEELPSHKIILAACSPVFAAMFEHDMLEREQNVVKIDDIQYDVLKEMLQYVYKGELGCDAEMLCKVLAAADKYQLAELKNKCANQLAKNMTVRDVIKVLTVANQYNIEYLKILAMDFIKAHGGAVVRSADFKAMAQVDILADIARSMA